MGPRALQHVLCHYALQAKYWWILIWQFQTPTAKTVKFKSPPNFLAIRYVKDSLFLSSFLFVLLGLLLLLQCWIVFSLHLELGLSGQ